MPTRRSLLLLAAAGAAAGVAAAAAARWSAPPRRKPPVFTGFIAGVAVGGYDPVAYFTESAPRRGREDIALEHAGAVWRFASEANRDTFRAEPDRYAPRYGGYCAYAVAGGGTSEGDPEQWSIVAGSLYLNASARVKAKWELDVPGNIARADANWPAVLER